MSLLNGMIISKYLNYEFAYIWENEISFPDLKIITNQPNIINHAIAPENSIFDSEFISSYSTSNHLTKTLHLSELNDKNLDIDNLDRTLRIKKTDGLTSPRLLISDLFIDSRKILNKYSYQEALTSIKFTPKLTNVMKAADGLLKNNSHIALHLRSGDVFYGEYRKLINYTYKGIVLPIAKEIIKHYQELGYNVLVLGQDPAVINHLKKNFRIKSVCDFNHLTASYNTTEQAFFELILMSKAKEIIAGSSGYARLAAAIGDKELISMTNLFGHQAQTNMIIDDLNRNAHLYPPLQSSFAYWYAYYFGRANKSIALIKLLLENAIKYDPENYTYRLVLAAEFYKRNLTIDGDLILQHLINSPDFQLNELKYVLNSRIGATPNLSEYLPHLYSASEKSTTALLIQKTLQGNNY